ncbi:MAG TPA: hypothetical protein VGQ17_01460 [Gemmatimonadales bacterium]|nr:hypothetical protein [Gemmatimonadales bacterium]
MTRPSLAVPTFQFLGDLPGGSNHAIALGVSADGRFVVGESSSTLSGVIDLLRPSSNREAFLWDANTGAMMALGDVTGGRFSSVAKDVSADGRVVVGHSEDAFDSRAGVARTAPFRWTATGGMVKLNGATIGAIGGFAGAFAVSNDGSKVVGIVDWADQQTFQEFVRAFVWQGGNVKFLSYFPADSLPPPAEDITLQAISPNGLTIVGTQLDIIFRMPFSADANLQENLGRIGTGGIKPTAVATDGKTIVGGFVPQVNVSGAFRWREGDNPKYFELPPNGAGATGVSADGRIVLDQAGSLYLDGKGPFDLREILAESGVIDLRSLARGLFDANAISDSGMVIVGRAFTGGRHQAWRARLTDCDLNGLPDELERRAYPDRVASISAKGSELFASDARESLGYGDMISTYGRPWQPGTNRVPELNPDQPAEFLRALGGLSTCVDGAIVAFLDEARRFFFGNLLPAARELHAFEMLLGNEALSDALDPTIGLKDIGLVDLGDHFAFKGVRGIDDLIDEELALLRGRELPGEPADWVEESIYYPEYKNPANAADTRRAAVYNRLPPNADGFEENAVAYRSNYGEVASNFEAAEKFPQGHGDAYGHYLTAMAAGIRLLSTGTEGIPAEFMDDLLADVAGDDGSLEAVRELSQAAVARAEAAGHVAELLFRRDYFEDPVDPRAELLFADPDGERAWSMADWARRGAMGAYLDWAVVNHLAPADEARPVNRAGLPELNELAASAGALQERLDTAGAGLDPLGLVQNVVPFGIDASGLEPGSGRSHYQQVREAAKRALENAAKAFENANQASQRLRNSGNSFEEFADKLEDTKVDFDQQLIEIFGLASPDDPANNDDDPDDRTSDFEESQSLPDLVSFFLSEEDLAGLGMRPRLAPGEVQIALSELKIAALRLEQAELAIDDVVAQVQSQLERIDKVVDASQERRKIIDRACDEQFDVVDRMQALQRRRSWVSLGGKIGAGLAGLSGENGNPAGLIGALSDGVNLIWDEVGDNEFDIEKEKVRIQCQKEADMQYLEAELNIDAERRQLKSLMRQIPQRIVDRSIQQELVQQAAGRLRQAAARGQLILEKKLRLVARTEGGLLRQRWQDLSFRIFRNASLKNYRALFDLAARYVLLAGRAFAYEFDKRSDGDDILAGIYRERRLGREGGAGGGLQAVLARLDANAEVEGFNRPFEANDDRGFSFRTLFLGIDNQEPFPKPDLRFRAFLEQSIVERLEDLSEIQDLAQVSVERDYGPAIVIPFSTEVDAGRNFFGKGPDLPFGNANFSLTRNIKIRNFAIRLDGVDPSPLGADPQSGIVFVYLLPAGDSVLRENTNKPRIEDELVTQWGVIDQFLPPPAPIGDLRDLAKRSFNPWRSTAQSGGNFLNVIKRQRDAEAQIELGQPLRFNTNLAGRSAWNTRWLLVIPGSQWTSSGDPVAIRGKLLQFIYGREAKPADGRGITDIRLIIQGYTH